MDFLKPILKKYRIAFIFGPFFKFLEAVFELLLPLFMAKLIDSALNGNHDISRLAIAMPLISIAGIFSALICQYLASLASQGTGTELRKLLLNKIHHLSSESLLYKGSEFYLNLLTNDINKIQNVVAMTIRLLIRAPFICVGSIIMTFFINWRLGLVALAVMPLFALVIFIIAKFSIKMYRNLQDKIEYLTNLILDTFNGVRVIKAFGGEKRQINSFADANHRTVKSSISADFLVASLGFWIVFFFQIAELVILYIASGEFNRGILLRADIIAVINYFNYLIMAMIVVANLAVLYPQGIAAAKRIKSVLDMPELTDDPATANLIMAEKNNFFHDEAVIKVENLTYSYPNSSVPAIRNINFAIKKGQTLGIVGGTGSGKTTLLNIIMGMVLPGEGKVQVGNLNLQAEYQFYWSQFFANVNQDTVLFSGTVADNLFNDESKISEEYLQKALTTAQADSFIKLPDDLTKNVQSGGKNFSGGQRQRLCIARALLQDAPILILDDPFSALDFFTAANLRRDLFLNYPDQIKIITSQRIENIKNSDLIIVLNNGEGIACGNHQELLRSCPIYKNVYDIQQGMYLADNDSGEVSPDAQ